jgi:hypothetical protein
LDRGAYAGRKPAQRDNVLVVLALVLCDHGVNRAQE